MTFDADPTTATEKLKDAQRFVERAAQYLDQAGWL